MLAFYMFSYPKVAGYFWVDSMIRYKKLRKVKAGVYCYTVSMGHDLNYSSCSHIIQTLLS
jgi:hypothetical protein